jgi:threonine dehydratase
MTSTATTPPHPALQATASPFEIPSEADLRRARERIAAALPPTPAIAARTRDAWLKLENLQVTGAFKVRGAFNAVAHQVEHGDRRPVFAASAGNHGQGVAWAARRLGLAAHVVVPRGAPAAKIDGCRALGAEVTIAGDSFEASWRRAERLAAERGGRLIHAFDDPHVIAGQATVAWELLGLDPDLVLVPVGGGGLAAGVGLVLAPLGIRVIGVRVEGAGADGAATVADGLRVAALGSLPARLCRRFLAGVVTAREADVRRAMRRLACDEKVVAEGAGAAAFAALDQIQARRPVAVISGGNVDPRQLASLLGEGPR